MARIGLPGIAGALALVLVSGAAALAEESLDGVLLRGGGSSFAAPLFQSWIAEFGKLQPGLQVEYDSIGSGEGMVRLVSDPGGTDAYPLVTLTWAMVHQRYADPKKAAAVRAFLGWGLGDGQVALEPLGHIRLADDLTVASRTSLATVQ